MGQYYLTILIILGCVFSGMYLSSEWKDFQNLQASNEELRKTSEEMDELIQNRDSLLEKINSVSKTDLARIDKALPQGPQAGRLLVLIEGLASRHQVVLNSLDIANTTLQGAEQKPQAPGLPRPGGAVTPVATQQEKDEFKEFPLSLNVSGPYASIKSFLKAVETNLRIMDIQSTNLGVGEKDKFEIGIRAKAYYQ